MSARDDYPSVRDIGADRLHHHGGLYEKDGRQCLAALDEIDRLRERVAQLAEQNNRLSDVVRAGLGIAEVAP